MKLFHLPGFTIELVFGSLTSVTSFDLFLGCFLDGSCFFKEPTWVVFRVFEAFSYNFQTLF